MNRSDLVDILQVQGLAKTHARRCVDALLGGIADALARGEPVHLARFGNLDLRVKGARSGKVAGRAYDRPARHTVRFRAAKALAERLPAPAPKDE
jgi:nucleoid DNA-binding protein